MENFDKLTKLAKLNFLDDSSQKKAENQVAKILEMMATLSSTSPMSSAADGQPDTTTEQTVRTDSSKPQNPSSILQNAPNTNKDGLFLVPQVIEG